MEQKVLGSTGERVPVLGLGTWGIGGFSSRSTSHDREAVRAVEEAVEEGMTLIDTAEMYGGGHSEELVGEAIEGLREDVFLATKVSPENLRYDDLLSSAEGSLRRLGVSYVDLYQVHWPNPSIPIEETMRAMEKLVRDGKTRYIGVSNFSKRQTREAQESLSREELVSDQVRYNLLDREIETELLPYCQEKSVTVIAYSPLAKGRLLRGGNSRVLERYGDKYDRTPAQVALNWLIEKDEVIAIPKSIKPRHIEDNATASGWRMSEADYKRLGNEF